MREFCIIAVICCFVACASQKPETFDKQLAIALLRPCYIAELKSYTKDEVVRVANQRKQDLVACNKDKERVRELLK